MAAAQELLTAYLIVGEDGLKRDEVLSRLVKRVCGGEAGDFDCDFFDPEAQQVSGREVVDAANTLPFMQERRLVVVRNVEKLAKADSEELVAYLSDPSPTTVLALVAAKLAKSTRLYKAVVKVGPRSVIECAVKKARELPDLVVAMGRSHGVTIDRRTAEELVDRVGETTLLLDAEVKKLASIAAGNGSTTVTMDDVRGNVQRVAEVKPWDFTDALCNRDAHQCLVLLSRMPSQSRIGLLALCVTRIRELICAKALEDRGQGALLAETLGVPDWRVRNHRRWASRFTAEELRRALEGAAATERAMKTGSDQELAFERWFLSVCN